MRICRRDSTVVVEVEGHVVTAGLAALRNLLADLIEGQGNLFVAVEVGDEGEPDPILLAAVAEAGAASPRCHLSVLAVHHPVPLLPARASPGNPRPEGTWSARRAFGPGPVGYGSQTNGAGRR